VRLSGRVQLPLLSRLTTPTRVNPTVVWELPSTPPQPLTPYATPTSPNQLDHPPTHPSNPTQLIADLSDAVLTTVLTYLEFLRLNLSREDYCLLLPSVKVREGGGEVGDRGGRVFPQGLNNPKKYTAAAALAAPPAAPAPAVIDDYSHILLPLQHTHAHTHKHTHTQPQQTLLEDYGVRLEVAMTAYRPVMRALEHQSPSMAEEGEAEGAAATGNAAAAAGDNAAAADAEMEEGEAAAPTDSAGGALVAVAADGDGRAAAAADGGAGPGGLTWSRLMEDLQVALPGVVPDRLSSELVATFWGLTLPDIMFPANR